MKSLSLLIAAALLIPACAGSLSPAEQISEARSSIQSRDYEAAESLASAAVDAATKAGDEGQALVASKLRLEAMAGQGKGEATAAALTKVGATYAGKLDAAFCAKLVQKVDAAGDTLGAIAVLDAGSKQFPGSKDKFAAHLELLKEKATKLSDAGDSAALERLKSLGYL